MLRCLLNKQTNNSPKFKLQDQSESSLTWFLKSCLKIKLKQELSIQAQSIIFLANIKTFMKGGLGPSAENRVQKWLHTKILKFQIFYICRQGPLVSPSSRRIGFRAWTQPVTEVLFEFPTNLISNGKYLNTLKTCR